MNKNRTFEECAAVAAKFETRNDLRVSANAEYKWLYRRGLIDAACAHMKVLRRSVSNDQIAKVAKQYSAIAEFQKADFSVYNMARRRGILRDVCAHMGAKNRYYSDDEIRQIATQFRTRIGFFNGDLGAYKAAHRRGMLDEVCSHMEFAPSGFCMDIPAVLYQFRICTADGLVLYKVGISNRSPSKRLKDMGLNPGVHVKMTHCIKFAHGRDARMTEKLLHRQFASRRYSGAPIMSNGNTEVFTVPVFD